MPVEVKIWGSVTVMMNTDEDDQGVVITVQSIDVPENRFRYRLSWDEWDKAIRWDKNRRRLLRRGIPKAKPKEMSVEKVSILQLIRRRLACTLNGWHDYVLCPPHRLICTNCLKVVDD